MLILRLQTGFTSALKHEVDLSPGLVDHFGVTKAKDCGGSSSDVPKHEVGFTPECAMHFVQS